MGKITEGMIHVTYAVAKDVHEGRISQKGGLDFLESELGMNRKSALVYLHNYKCMVEGRFFSRVMSAYGIRYFLESIYEDSSRSGLLKALNAFREHLDYHELVVGSNVVERRKLYDEFWCLAELRAGEETSYPDEVDSREALLEGHVKQVTVNVYERNAAARVKCIEHYGCSCFVCGLDFESKYGIVGRGFIHVHHEVEISSVGKEYIVDPISDLKPVCPNCHAMLHRKRPAYTIDELKKALNYF